MQNRFIQSGGRGRARGSMRMPLRKRVGLVLFAAVLSGLLVQCGQKEEDEEARAEARAERERKREKARAERERMQEEARLKEYEAKLGSLLVQAQELNRNRVSTLADAQAKGITIRCTKEDAAVLLGIVVNPFMKNAEGANMLGPDPVVVDVARNGCVLLAVAAEQDPAVCDLIFQTLAEECNNPAFDDKLFRFMIDLLNRIGIPDMKVRLKALSKEVLAKATVKGAEEKWKKRGKIAGCIWECIGMSINGNDVPDIIALLQDDSCDPEVAQTLAPALANLFMRSTKDTMRRAEYGDRIFDALPDKLREDKRYKKLLALSGSPKAYAYFTARAGDPKNWKGDMIYFGNYQGGENVFAFMESLKAKAAGDAAHERAVAQGLELLLAQNVDRTDEEADKLISLVFGTDLEQDTSSWIELSDKLDEYSATYEPDFAKREEYKKQLATVRKFHNSKRSFIATLKNMYDYPWVVKNLEKLSNDGDFEVSFEAKAALEYVKSGKRKMEDAKRQSDYDARQR